MNSPTSYIMRKRFRKKRIRLILQRVILVLVGLLCMCTAVLLYAVNRAPTLPTWEEAIRMDDATLMEAIRTASPTDLLEAWGDPVTEWNEEGWDDHYMIWKSDHSLDHIYVYLDKETRSVMSVSVVYVFEALPVFVGNDYSWATVTPCAGEDELDYGDLMKINLVGRHAVFDSMYDAPQLPVRVYYKGTPHLSEDGEMPYIDTVIDVNYFDYFLEPIDDKGES